jgi:hypothetical protein
VDGELLGERLDRGRVERRREQQRLQPAATAAAPRQLGMQLAYGVEAAGVEQPVGLVEHEELHRRERELAALRQVEHAPRRAAHDVHPAAQAPQLRGRVDAAHEERRAQRGRCKVAAKLAHLAVHLLRELARRLEDEGGGAAPLGVVRVRARGKVRAVVRARARARVRARARARVS